MVALRKDVKLGLTLGGIVLSVVGVYVGLTALAGGQASGNGTGASLVATGGAADAGHKPSANNNSAGPSNNGSRTVQPPPTPIEGSRTTVADAAHPTGAAPAGPGNVTPTSPLNTSGTGTAQRTSGGPVDPWDEAFTSGQLNGPPHVTTTPDPTRVATNTNTARPTNTTPPVAPTDIINELNGPRGGSPTPAPAPAGGNNATANANDASGAMNAGGTSQQLTQMTQHTVANGETLSTIAAEYYGNSKYYQLIATANPSVNPNALKIGQVLRIPPRPTTMPSSETAGGAAPVRSAGPIDPSRQYVVKANDSLHKIAQSLYGDSTYWEKIYNTNRNLIGSDPARLKLGMVLTLPAPPTHR